MDIASKSREELIHEVLELHQRLEQYSVELEKSGNIQTMLYKISQAATVSRTLEEFLRLIQHELKSIISADNFFVCLYYEDSGLYSFPLCIDEYEEDEFFFPQEMNNSLTDYVRRTGEPLMADKDVHYELIRLGEVEMVGAPSKSWLGVPLKTALGTIGVVVVQDYYNEGIYTARDVNLLKCISEYIAMSIEHKRTEEELAGLRNHIDEIVEERTQELNEVIALQEKQIARLKENKKDS